jgi:hypothetical protein
LKNLKFGKIAKLPSDPFSASGKHSCPKNHFKSRANDVFDLMAGFVYTQILLACVQVNIFNLLADGPKTKEKSFSVLFHYLIKD